MAHISRIEVAVGIQSLGKGGDPSRELIGMNCRSTDLGTLSRWTKQSSGKSDEVETDKGKERNANLAFGRNAGRKYLEECYLDIFHGG